MVIVEFFNVEFLFFFNVDGVLDGDKLLIGEFNVVSILKYVDEGVIIDGMKVKVDVVFVFVENLGCVVYIVSWVVDINDILNKKMGM